MATSHSSRPFGLWTATSLVVGGMIGAGIYVQPAQLAPYGATGALAWVFAIPAAMVLAFVLTRLTQHHPQATGALAIIGDGLGPLPGVLVGWSYWIGIVSANAIIALTAVRYLGSIVPGLTVTPLITALGATALLWTLTGLNLGGAKAAGRFQVITTALKLLPLIAVVLILAGLALLSPSQFSGQNVAPLNWAQLTPAVTLAFFPMVGFESAAMATERVRDPARNVMRATLWGAGLTGLFYFIICNGIVYALPADRVAAADAPIALFVEQFWGRGAGIAVAAFAAISAIGCLNGWVLLQGQVPLGMARAGLLPALLGRTNARDVPVFTVLLGTGFITLLILSGAVPGVSNLLTFMLQLTTAATVWFYASACLVALRQNVARPAAALGLPISGWILWGSGAEAVLLSLLLMACAVPLYFIALRGVRTAAAAG